MTTETPRDSRRTGMPTVVSLAVTVLAGAVMVGVAALATGSSGAAGAAIGLVMAGAFFALGAFVLELVARVLPAASLMVALLTYTLQVALIGLVFAGLRRSGALDRSIDSRWLAGTLIVCTITWLVTQVVVHVRQRIPAYDLPASGPEASTR